MELRTVVKGPLYPDIPPLNLSYEEKGELIQLAVVKALNRYYGGLCSDAVRFVEDCKEATRKELIFLAEKHIHINWH
jgi:hypothetical protein